MEDLLTTSPWLGSLLWAVLFVLNHELTIAGARLYARNAAHHIVYEGGYTDSKLATQSPARVWSDPALIAWFIGVSSALAFYRWGSMDMDFIEAYLVVIGGMLLMYLPMYFRHARNLALFLSMSSGHVTGQISYPRWIGSRLAAVEFFAFAVILALAYFANPSWFVLGGALSCAYVGFTNWWTATKLLTQAAMPDAT